MRLIFIYVLFIIIVINWNFWLWSRMEVLENQKEEKTAAKKINTKNKPTIVASAIGKGYKNETKII